jgi:uncharacterized protein YndB with AHSA1/START domain
MTEHVSRTVLIEADVADVWDALIDPARLEDWLADEVEASALTPDAEVVFRWDDGRERVGVIEQVDAPVRLALRWVGGDGRESKVVLELGEEEGGTRVTVTESAPAATWGSRLAMLANAACAVAA